MQLRKNFSGFNGYLNAIEIHAFERLYLGKLRPRRIHKIGPQDATR
jgi:hypothetical protein